MSNHIQISDVTPRIQYVADGSQTQFSYPFPIFMGTDLEVYTGDNKEISGYSVLGAGISDGGSVTFDKPPASGVVVTLRRSLAIDRTTDFQQSGVFRAKDINDELDYLTAALQQVADGVGRAVRLSSTDEGADLELPSKDERANKVLGFDASGDVIATSGSGRSGGGVTDHGQLTGLSDDDHGQYHTDARGDARYYTRTALDIGQLDGRYYTETEVDSQFAALGSAAALEAGTAVDDVLQLEDVGGGTPGLPAVDGSRLTGLPSGVSDHGALTGLSDDDHPLYHNDTRGDARYYTQGQVDTALGGKSDTNHNHDSAYAAIAHVSDTANPHSVTAAQAGALPTGTKLDDLAAPDDNTDLNATTSKHGLLPKLSGVASEFLNGAGAFSTPAGGGVGGEANLSTNSGTGFSILASTPKNGVTFQFRGVKSPSGTITVSHDDTNENVDLAVNSVPESAVTDHAAALTVARTNVPAVDSGASRTMAIASDLGSAGSQEGFIRLSHATAQFDVVKNIAEVGQRFMVQWTNASPAQTTPFTNSGGGCSFVPSSLPEIDTQYQTLCLLCVDATTDANVFQILPAAL